MRCGERRKGAGRVGGGGKKEGKERRNKVCGKGGEGEGEREGSDDEGKVG